MFAFSEGSMEQLDLLGGRGLSGGPCGVSPSTTKAYEPLRPRVSWYSSKSKTCWAGLTAAVAEVLSEHCPKPVKRLGIIERYGASVHTNDLWRSAGCQPRLSPRTSSHCWPGVPSASRGLTRYLH